MRAYIPEWVELVENAESHTTIANLQRAGALPPWGTAETARAIPTDIIRNVLAQAEDGWEFVSLQEINRVPLLYRVQELRAELKARGFKTAQP